MTGTIVAKEVKAAPGYVIDQSTQTQTVTVNPEDTQNGIINLPGGNGAGGGAITRGLHGDAGSVQRPYLSQADHAASDLYCFNFYFMDRFMGVATFHSNSRTFLDCDLPLMDHLFRYIKRAFLRYLSEQNYTTSPELQALRRLMDKESVHASDLPSLDAKRWICFKLRKQPSRKSLSKNYMRACVNSLLSGQSFCLEYHGELMGVIALNQEIRAQESPICNEFSCMIQKMGYLCGFSNEFLRFEDVAAYYPQAAYAVETCCKDAASTPVFFSDCALQYVLNTCAGSFSNKSLFPPGLSALATLDQNERTEYIKTLSVYLDLESNATKAAG